MASSDMRHVPQRGLTFNNQRFGTKYLWLPEYLSEWLGSFWLGYTQKIWEIIGENVSQCYSGFSQLVLHHFNPILCTYIFLYSAILTMKVSIHIQKIDSNWRPNEPVIGSVIILNHKATILLYTKGYPMLIKQIIEIERDR